MVRNKINHQEMARKLDNANSLMEELLRIVQPETMAARVIILMDSTIDVVREYMDDQFMKEADGYDVRVYYPKEK